MGLGAEWDSACAKWTSAGGKWDSAGAKRDSAGGFWDCMHTHSHTQATARSPALQCLCDRLCDCGGPDALGHRHALVLVRNDWSEAFAKGTTCVRADPRARSHACSLAPAHTRAQ